LGIVDVPGHEDFVKNMVAGVGSIDIALLVVAADDRWMPQTEEHLQILQYLGVTRAVVALNKIDLVVGGEAAAKQSIRDQLAGTPFAKAPIVPTAAISGQGIQELKTALAQVLARTPPPPDIGKPRLPIDRAFTLHGIGTVVTGTLTGGWLFRGRQVIVQPGGLRTRIRTLQTHGHETESVAPGTRAAANLVDVDVAGKATEAAHGVGRGQIVTLPDFGPATATWDVILERFGRSGQPTNSTEPTRLRDGVRVRVHHGSGCATARLLLLNATELDPGGRELAELRFDSPTFAFIGDRFVIRDWSEQQTLAGGLVLDLPSDRRLCRKPGQHRLLERRAQASASPNVAIETLLERDGFGRPAVLLLKSHFSADQIQAAIRQLQTEGKVALAGEFLVETGCWKALQAKALQAIDARHKSNPQQLGLPLTQLRSALEHDLSDPALFEPLVAALLGGDVRQTGTNLKRATHQPALPAQLQAAGAQVRAALAAKPMEPPSRKEIAPDAARQQALRFLIQTGEAVELGSEVVLLAESVSKATDLVRSHLRQRGSATVSDLRQVIGASRRIVVPLLEKLDREGLTRRQGDLRVLAQPVRTG
jgi:selenocysteine-specific elongation factor